MYNKELIFDFDGTIARIFANYNLDAKVKMASEIFKKYNIDFSLDNDLFDSYKFVDKTNENERNKLLFELNELITKAEVEAVKTAEIITGFSDYINYLIENNIKLNIVSNNSKECIEEFFKNNFKKVKINVIGRIWNNPKTMKPNDYLLHQMCNKLNKTPKDIIYIGDNPRDYECSNKFGCEFIAMVPTKSKKERMINYNFNIKLFNNYYELLDCINNK